MVQTLQRTRPARRPGDRSPRDSTGAWGPESPARKIPLKSFRSAYLLVFEAAGPNLTGATELSSRLRTRGLLDQ
jgi:hypothetical protein